MNAPLRRTETHCANGHRWADGYLYYDLGNRHPKCRACYSEAHRRYYQRYKRPPLTPDHHIWRWKYVRRRQHAGAGR